MRLACFGWFFEISFQSFVYFPPFREASNFREHRNDAKAVQDKI
jgi:hypothetical protein